MYCLDCLSAEELVSYFWKSVINAYIKISGVVLCFVKKLYHFISDKTFLLLFTTGLEFELMFPTEIINMLIISNSNVILLLVHV